MTTIYYIFLFITVISYLIGLFLSQFENKEKMATGSGELVKTFEMESKNNIDEEII